MSPEGTRKIEMQWDLPHAPAKVWRALTEPALVAQWLLPSGIEAKPGHRFQFQAPALPHWDGIVQSEVLALEPGKKLAYAWNTGGPQGLDTQVIWTLVPIAGGTRLSLEHAGFKPEQQFAFAGAGQGWQRNVSERMNAVLAALN
jgi:uncharacterized protein YndB with AHSA1/START domain